MQQSSVQNRKVASLTRRIGLVLGMASAIAMVPMSSNAMANMDGVKTLYGKDYVTTSSQVAEQKQHLVTEATHICHANHFHRTHITENGTHFNPHNHHLMKAYVKYMCHPN